MKINVCFLLVKNTTKYLITGILLNDCSDLPSSSTNRLSHSQRSKWGSCSCWLVEINIISMLHSMHAPEDDAPGNLPSSKKSHTAAQ
jgi:hypothetical protein